MVEVPHRAVMAAFDIDGVLNCNDPNEKAVSDAALGKLHAGMERLIADPARPFHYGPATGRRMWSVQELQQRPDNATFDAVMSTADFAVTSVGSVVSIRNSAGRLAPDPDWPLLEHRLSWDPAAVHAGRPLSAAADSTATSGSTCLSRCFINGNHTTPAVTTPLTIAQAGNASLGEVVWTSQPKRAMPALRSEDPLLRQGYSPAPVVFAEYGHKRRYMVLQTDR